MSIGEHGFKYPRHGIIVQHPLDTIPYVREADIVMFMHSSYIDLGPEYKNKRLFVFHGGTAYRQNSEALNKHFNPIVERSVIQTADLLGKGAKNEVWVLPPVDTYNIQPVYEQQRDKPVVAHYPSNQWKGTEMICSVIAELQKDYDFYWEHSTEIVPWEENIKRMAECDIYIDGICPIQGAEKYGEWGVQTLEAMALGKVTIAHGAGTGFSWPVIANNGDELRQMLGYYLNTMTRQTKFGCPGGRHYVEWYHSYDAVGGKLKEQVFEL